MYGLGSGVTVLPGYLALRSIRREPAALGGKGFAIAGIALSRAGIAAALVILAVIPFSLQGGAEASGETCGARRKGEREPKNRADGGDSIRCG